MTMKYGWHRADDEPFACNTCGAKPCVNPRFCRLCRAADRRLAKQKLEMVDADRAPQKAAE